MRTIYRDVEALSAAGVPVYATRGRSGGIQLLDGYRTRLTGMTADEADALFLAGLPGAAADLGLGSVLAATQLKLLAALPPELRERAARIRDRFYLDAPGWLRETDAPPFLASVAEAVWTQHRLDVRYERANRAVADRVLDPLGLVLKAGTWYLVARRRRRPRPAHLPGLAGACGGRARRDVRAAGRLRPRGVLGRLPARLRGARLPRARRVVRLSPQGRELLFLIGTIAGPPRPGRR